ncbi:Ankyrin repeat [Lasiodiplodia hormozganensis]|uniref:Ankyrin repeat n=1 Tax=Lasiodiplodia hormozganensis TaxID=869390 RepID=A0AA39WZG9_9PEZI|nr:Ankyrin repeat [Lasiodiplodia hormozganensis]
MRSRFQWVVCQLDQLLDHPQTESFGDDEIDEALRTLPQTLTDTYDRILDHIPKPRKNAAYRLLQILLFCQRPIRVLEANEFLSVNCSGFNVSKRIKYPREVTRYCSSLVTLRGPHSEDSVDRSTEIVLAHASVRDYLLFNRTLGEGVDIFGQLEANKAIFKTCLYYIDFLSMPNADPYNQDLYNSFPLADYATRYLFEHASAAGTDEETVNAATAFCRNGDAFRTWVCHRSLETALHFCDEALNHALMEKVMKASTWYTAARYGLKDYLQVSLERESYSVCKITSSSSPPFGFWVTGHQSKGNASLQTCQPLFLDGEFYETCQSISPLYAAAEAGHEGIVRMLIEAGFTVDEVGGPQGTALDVACARGCVGAVEALLEKTKQRSPSTMWFEETLRQGVRTGSSQLVQVFLNHGFLTHSAQPSIESAIFDAALYGNTTVVQELLRHCRGLRNLADLSLPLSPTNTPSFLGRLSSWIPNVFSWSGGTSHQHSPAQSLESYDGAWGQQSAPRHSWMLLGEPGGRARLFSTALQAAAFEGHEEIVKALLEEGRDPNATGGYFGTALQAAAAGGSPRVVQRLLDDGADPNTAGGFFKTALNASLMIALWATEDRHKDNGWGRLADICSDGLPYRSKDWHMNSFKDRFRELANYEAVAAALLKAGAQPFRGSQDLQCALKLESQEFALNMIENAASGAGRAEGDFHTVATLLRGEDVADSAPLHDAISQGFSRVVKSMIRYGAAMDVIDNCGRTPLHHAMRQNNQDVAFMVIQAVAQQPDAVGLLKTKDSSSMTAVHYAAQLPVSSETMKHLLRVAKQAGILTECLNARSNNGRTALHHAPHSIFNKTLSMVELLIDAAASAGILEGYVNVRDDRGETALHRAASCHDVHSIMLLLRAGADEEALNLDKQNFVDCARARGGIERLFDVGPEATGPFYSSVEEARAFASVTLLKPFVELNDVATVKKLAGKATFHCSFLDITDADYGMTFLHHAAEKGYAALGELLLDLGAQFEAVDKEKMTPLHHAAKGGCLAMVTALLQRIGNEEEEKRPLFSVADFREDDFNGFLTNRPSDHQDLSGNTPLHYAVENRSIEMVKCLVYCGATMHRRNKEGNTPLDLAQEKRESFPATEIHIPRDIAAVNLIARFLEEEDEKYDGDY